MKRSTIDIWVGAFVAAGFAGLLFLALKVGNLASFSTAQTYRVEAKFANIGGLKVRAPIKSAGVVSGGCRTSGSTTKATKPSLRSM
jgi:phospholipid/cholesterol/gamma-HCH transport system substrate-binding protein